MPKRAAGLTALQVTKLSSTGMYADGNGLYLQVTTTGAKTWIFRYALGGRRRDMGLGSTSIVTLAVAREKALDAKRQVASGVDPIEARRALAAAKAVEAARMMTFRQVAEAYVEAMRPGWKNEKHAAQWSTTLEAYAFPTLGSLPVGAVDTNLVVQVLEPIWNTKTETASRLRGRIEAILDYGKVRGYRAGENPARWRGHLDHILPHKADVAQVEHHPALLYAEMREFWPKLQAQDGLGARALELAILCASRTAEVLGARWDEIDMDAGVWVISGLMSCGVCGGGFSKISRDHYGCSRARNNGTCTNILTIRRDVVEQRVIDGLQRNLMRPTELQVFVEAYNAELNRL